MIDDFAPPPRKKPKVIEPLEKPSYQPLPVFDDEPAPATFQTPEQVTAHETPLGSDDSPIPPHQQSAKFRWHLPSVSWPPSKREALIMAAVALVIIGAGSSVWALTHRSVKATPSKVVHLQKKVVTPVIITSTLTGLPTDAAANQRPVTGVMIENSPDARPQSGLDQAGVVFEAIAEGGITRFLALYQDTQPSYLGPVRSARPYYVQWALGFDAGYAHVGGSPEALTDIKSWGVRDLDQFYNSGAYERISTRYAPHNVYTSAAQLNQLESAKGYTSSTFTGFARKKDAPSKTPNASSIDMNISASYYNSHYDYDAASNSYKRSEGGAAHMELNKDGSQTQIQPKVVIAMVMQYGIEADDEHSAYNVIGSGQAFIFQDGTVTTGNWNKSDAKSQITFTDASGKAIALNAGQTWLTALSAANQVTYK